MTRGAYARATDRKAIAAVHAGYITRISNALALAGYRWPADRPKTAQTLYNAMCRVKGQRLRAATLEECWAALRRWLAEIDGIATSRAPVEFRPYVMPPAMRQALERCRPGSEA